MDSADITIVVKSTDMTPDEVGEKTMVMESVLCSQKKGELNIKGMAKQLKEELDAREDNPCWNVVVGKSFGASFKHTAKTLAYVRVGPLSMMIWRIL